MFKGHFEAAKTTFYKAGGEEALEGATIKETNENFVKATRELWQKFAVHGILRENYKTGEKEIKPFTDLDGKSAIGLLKLSGLTLKNVSYLNPGDYKTGAINLDTGKKMGVKYQAEDDTTFFDHHPESGELYETSATDLVYKTVTKLDLLKRQPYLNKMVEFINYVDNKSFPDQEKYFLNSDKTFLGLQRFASFESTLKFFKDGRLATENLSSDDLINYGFKYKDNQGRVVDRSAEQKKIIDTSWSQLKEMEKNGFIRDSKKYGRVAIDIGSKVSGGTDAARAYGCDVYINWHDTGFFISSNKDLDNDFVLSEGIKIRMKMYLKNDDGQALKIHLDEVLKKFGI